MCWNNSRCLVLMSRISLIFSQQGFHSHTLIEDVSNNGFQWRVVFTIVTVVVWITTVDGRNPAAPGMYKIWKFTISTGAGFLPSTASPGRQLQKKKLIFWLHVSPKPFCLPVNSKRGRFFGWKKNKAIPNKGVDYGLVYSLVQLTKLLRGVFFWWWEIVWENI